MKKVMSFAAMLAMSAMLAGCYSKACDEPVPVAPVPYKDSAVVTHQEDTRPARPAKRYKRRHHRAVQQDTTTQTEMTTTTEPTGMSQ